MSLHEHNERFVKRKYLLRPKSVVKNLDFMRIHKDGRVSPVKKQSDYVVGYASEYKKYKNSTTTIWVWDLDSVINVPKENEQYINIELTENISGKKIRFI